MQTSADKRSASRLGRGFGLLLLELSQRRKHSSRALRTRLTRIRALHLRPMQRLAMQNRSSMRIRSPHRRALQSLSPPLRTSNAATIRIRRASASMRSCSSMTPCRINTARLYQRPRLLSVRNAVKTGPSSPVRAAPRP